MKVTIDNKEKTILLEEDIEAKELIDFINKFELTDYKIKYKETYLYSGRYTDIFNKTGTHLIGTQQSFLY